MITARERLAFISAALAAGAAGGPVLAAAGVEGAKTGAPGDGADLGAAWAEFRVALGKASDLLQAQPYYRDAENRASAYAMMTAMVIKAIEMQTIIDPDFPIFHVHDARLLSSADNPDQRYMTSRVRGGETYRIWGRIGTERRLDVQLYSGAPSPAPQFHAVGFLRFEDMHIEPDGSFEVMVSPTRTGRNWLENPADATQVMVRQVYAEWSEKPPGEVHIDRVGYEGALRPAVTEAAMAQRLRDAGQVLVSEVSAYTTMHQTTTQDPSQATPVNTLPPPADTYKLGGAKGRYMTFGVYDLADDEALVLRMWPTGATYQAVHVRDMWNSSLEYSNRQTSLNESQCYRDADGSYWIVVGGKDPGIQNWLDTMGRRKGFLAFRFDGIGDKPFDPAKAPQMHKVKYAELKAKLPKSTPAFSGEQRFAAIATRRRQLQERCHY